MARLFDHPLWAMVFMFVCGITVLIIVFSSTPAKPVISVNAKNFKAEELGKIPGVYSWVYKVTVDSVDYIVVTKGEAVSIIKHSK